MPYLPPEGFSPYPGSHLYYRSENGIDPQTGSPCRWVTYFDPNAGTYHQVAYPFAEPTPEAKPREPPPMPRPTAQPQPEPPLAAPSPQKKGKGGLVAVLAFLAVLVVGGLSLWLTGAYTKLPFFSSGGSIGATRPGPSEAPQGLPEKGTPQRHALLALSVLFGDEGLHNNFQGLGDQELKIAAATYFSRAPEGIRGELDALNQDIWEMADSLPCDSYELMVGLRLCAMEAGLSTRLVEEKGDRAVVELTAQGRIDLDRVGEWLAALDYAAPFDDYLRERHGMTREEIAGGYYESGWPTYFMGYWAQELEGRWREELYTEEPYSVEVTMLRSEEEGWLMESAPKDLPKLFFFYTSLPMDLEEPYHQAMAAMNGAAEPESTNGPSAGTVKSGEYTFDLPDFGQAVLLILYPDETFYLETALGGDGYYAMGGYRVEGRTLLLTPKGDYYREAMGDLSNAMFEIGADGTLFLQSPASLGLMSAGERLSPSAPQQNPPIHESLKVILEGNELQEIYDYIEQYPSLSAFPSGFYLRADGNAVLMVDGSPSEDSLNYLVCALPSLSSGSKAGPYASPGSDHGYTNLCMVSGQSAVDDMNGIELLVTSNGGIQVSSNWVEEQYIAYEAPDGLYYPMPNDR